MFLGTYQPNLTEGGRIALPKKIREQLSGSRLVLTIGFENCIFGFSEKDWDLTLSGELAKPLFSDKEARDLRRKMCAEAINVELDSQGRFVIVPRMQEFLEGSDIVIIGAGDHFEIWTKNKWEEYRKQIEYK